jgi:prepilin peptidase CpaA
MSAHDTVAIGIGLVACAFDLRTGRIPNWLTLGAALVALVVSTGEQGLAGTGGSALGWIVALLLWLPLYALGGMGAGDVKLIAAVGAWLGPADVIHAALYAAIAGGGLAVILAVVRGRVQATFGNIQLLLAHWRICGFTPHPHFTLATADGPRLAYAVPVLAGTVVAIWLR